mmetsp:Transcript_27073/g.64705  ORF Transcript_27073/g.64705 Transcript_27073/m.64705 type:complete len:904 (-) Transcript_27073:212-2923(-)|eukprot:CAMPEP_0113461274 /NCGR_PEP_ID=MMETSP0014_2-20120614/11450_1 /TAXON_ID=2857 /ORGANISM="Nitzschia sp." /LENGTH=903 /DNA_ID=CAMNT_0000353017 /DNA_START=420 /DNA_END=3131 /DNA_ORIENTATION=+ /assembly_acc=CAM_ASM_000159
MSTMEEQEPAAKKTKTDDNDDPSRSIQKNWKGCFDGLDSTQLSALYRAKQMNFFLGRVQKILPSSSCTLLKTREGMRSILKEWKEFVDEKTMEVADLLTTEANLTEEAVDELDKLHHRPSDLVDQLQQKYVPKLLDDVCHQFISSGWEVYWLRRVRPRTIEEIIEHHSTYDGSIRSYRETGRRFKKIPVQVIHSDENGNVNDEQEEVGCTDAYYLPHQSSGNFRHEGVSDRSPPRLYLQDLSSLRQDIVPVFYSASGSGKTAEIVGSSVTRDCHLTIVLQPADGEYKYEADDDEDGEAKDGGKEEVPTAAGRKQLSTLLGCIGAVAYGDKNVFKCLMDAASETNDKLKLVVAIDEASCCPNMVRSILRDVDAADRLVRETLCKCLGMEDTSMTTRLDNIKFSVAGTGAFAVTSGSADDAYEVTQSTYSQYHDDLKVKLLKCVPDHLVRGGGTTRMNLSTCVSDVLPVISVMMENGRMGSIACASLKEHPAGVPIVESNLVENIVTKFMRSNGLDDLRNYPEHQCRVAAAALAVHLFQGKSSTAKLPNDADEYHKVAMEMDFALELCQDITKKNVTVEGIMSRYGLLEPNPDSSEQIWELGAEIKRPFVIPSSQQIIALYMMGVELETLPFDFGTLSTHLVKCAVAASLAVSESGRPDLQSTLKTIGFQVCDVSTDSKVKEQWNLLAQWKAVGSKSLDGNGKESKTVSLRTRQLQAGLLIETKEGKDPAEEVLAIETSLYRTLKGLKPSENIYSSPVTCLNGFSSPFADGFVTFYVKDMKEPGDNFFKFTIMNHSKDYQISPFDTETLQQHVQSGKHELLDPHFGVARLLCVSSSQENLIHAKELSAGQFLPFCVDQSIILHRLFGTLTKQKQRSRAKRLKRYAIMCDEDGNPLEGETWQDRSI